MSLSNTFNPLLNTDMFRNDQKLLTGTLRIKPNKIYYHVNLNIPCCITMATSLNAWCIVIKNT